jgi:hypothetical protein
MTIDYWGRSTYVFVQNAPLTFVDPDGRRPMLLQPLLTALPSHFSAEDGPFESRFAAVTAPCGMPLADIFDTACLDYCASFSSRTDLIAACTLMCKLAKSRVRRHGGTPCDALLFICHHSVEKHLVEDCLTLHNAICPG